jgi:hypothetical protein
LVQHLLELQTLEAVEVVVQRLVMAVKAVQES